MSSQGASAAMGVDSMSAGAMLMAVLEHTVYATAAVTLDNTHPPLSYRFSHPTIRAHFLQAGAGGTVEISIAFVPPAVLVSPTSTTTTTSTTTSTTTTTLPTTTTVARPAPPVLTTETLPATTTIPATTTLQPLATTTAAPTCTPEAVFTSTSTTVNSSPAPCNLFGVATGGTGEEAWAVGQDGTVLATQDGGASWASETGIPTSESLRAVYFTPGSIDGWAVGDGGTIIATTDGMTWGPETSGTGADLLGVAFSGPYGVAAGAGGTVVVTSDSGTDWTSLTSTGTTLNAVAFSSASTAVAVGDSGTALQIYYDGTWRVSALPTGVAAPLYGVALFTSSGNTYGLAVGGGGTMVGSSDGTWFSELPLTSVDLPGVAVGQYGVAVGGDGTIVSPGCPGGPTVNAGTTEQLNAVALWNPTTRPFVAVGDGGVIVTGQATPFLLAC